MNYVDQKFWLAIAYHFPLNQGLPGENRKSSNISPFYSVLNSNYKGTPTEVFTQFKDEKRGPKLVCFKMMFLSSLYRKFHINFTVDNVFEIPVSTNIVQWSFQWFILFTPIVNNLVKTKRGHTKATSTFQIMIYNDLTEFFLCKWDNSVNQFTLNLYYGASTAKKQFSIL